MAQVFLGMSGGVDSAVAAALLYRADKASRMCLFCTAEPECNWSREKKNMTIRA